MHNKTAYVDNVQMAREFRAGDIVRRANYRDTLMTPYVGRVIYSNTETGVVMVQWPFGAYLEVPTELVRAGSVDFLPPLKLDQSYSTYEKSRYMNTEESAKSDEKWRKSLASDIVSDFESFTQPLYIKACQLFHDGVEEVTAANRLASECGHIYGFDTVDRTVKNLYGAGRRLALYWGNANRKYKRSQGEKATGIIKCPRCATKMYDRRYRQGKNIKQCRSCGFSIHSRDIM
jgi:hypothetical protein